MVEETYSAGLISQSFWFVEMKKVIKLIDDGKSEEEIKKIVYRRKYFLVRQKSIEPKGYMDTFGIEPKDWIRH